jgi:hypothetical protein
MEEKRPICITFAGVIGCSKTPISNYLSCKLGLPVFNNDAIRSEIIEDLGFFDEKIHTEKRNELISDILKNKRSFICDASQDREWANFKKIILEHGYDFFVISLDLSKDKLEELYKNKNYNESLLRLDQLILEHNKFIENYSRDIGISINDSDFERRLELSYLSTSLLFK